MRIDKARVDPFAACVNARARGVLFLELLRGADRLDASVPDNHCFSGTERGVNGVNVCVVDKQVNTRSCPSLFPINIAFSANKIYRG